MRKIRSFGGGRSASSGWLAGKADSRTETPPMPAEGITMSMVWYGLKEMACLKAAVWEGQERTSVWMKVAL